MLPPETPKHIAEWYQIASSWHKLARLDENIGIEEGDLEPLKNGRSMTPYNSVTFSITGGADAAKFDIVDGNLVFVVARFDGGCGGMEYGAPIQYRLELCKHKSTTQSTEAAEVP